MKFFRKPGKAGLAAKIPGEDKSGLYLTVTVHVAAVIVLLIFQLRAPPSEEGPSYLFDFSGIDQKEAGSPRERVQGKHKRQAR